MRTFKAMIGAAEREELLRGEEVLLRAAGVGCAEWVAVKVVPPPPATEDAAQCASNDADPGIREEEWTPRSLRPDRARELTPEEAGRVLGGIGLATSAEAEAAWAGNRAPPLLSPRDVLLMRAKELHHQAHRLGRDAEAAKATAAQYEQAAAILRQTTADSLVDFVRDRPRPRGSGPFGD